MVLGVDTSRGPATETLVRRGASARAADRLRSQSKIAAQKSPKGRARPVLYTPRLRANDLAKRGEAQGGRWRCAVGHTIRHVYRRRSSFLYFKKGFLMLLALFFT